MKPIIILGYQLPSIGQLALAAWALCSTTMWGYQFFNKESRRRYREQIASLETVRASAEATVRLAEQARDLYKEENDRLRTQSTKDTQTISDLQKRTDLAVLDARMNTHEQTMIKALEKQSGEIQIAVVNIVQDTMRKFMEALSAQSKSYGENQTCLIECLNRVNGSLLILIDRDKQSAVKS